MRLSRAMLLSATLLWLVNSSSLAAQVASGIPNGSAIEPWSAQWITCPDAPERDAFATKT
jgi:hypothetical protein